MKLHIGIILLGSCPLLPAQGSSALAAVPGFNPAPECFQRTVEDFVPMTHERRFAYAESATAGPEAFVFTGIRAAINQAVNRPREWKQGVRGFGLRSGSIYAEYFISQVIEHPLAWKFGHEDNRYFASGKRSLIDRVGYALASPFLARHDNGRRSLSYSAIGGTAAAAFISRSWQPRSTNSAADAGVSFGASLGVRAGLNILREFSPRLGRVLE